jgi:hypothetical protein
MNHSVHTLNLLLHYGCRHMHYSLNKCSSSRDNDIAKEVNGTGSIKEPNKYIKLILPVILYECEIWSHIYGRTGHRLTVFENKVLREILGIKQT